METPIFSEKENPNIFRKQKKENVQPRWMILNLLKWD
jgi:hypothetical protein